MAIWLMVLACASTGKPGIAAGVVIAAADLMSEGNFKATLFAIHDQSRKDWMDRLTNRCFYKLLFEEIRTGHSTKVDVDELFKLASAEALADIKRADDDSKIDAGALDSTAWHWFGGVTSFLWRCVSWVLYYGSAFYLGSAGGAQRYI